MEQGMPKGARGEKRPGDVAGAAIEVVKIATGEIQEDTDEPQSTTAKLGQKGAGAGRAHDANAAG
jgi:hypothetical protein